MRAEGKDVSDANLRLARSDLAIRITRSQRQTLAEGPFEFGIGPELRQIQTRCQMVVQDVDIPGEIKLGRAVVGQRERRARSSALRSKSVRCTTTRHSPVDCTTAIGKPSALACATVLLPAMTTP